MSNWTITSQAGVISFEQAGISASQINHKLLAASQSTFEVQTSQPGRPAWWIDDSIVTVYRDGLPFYTGRVVESPLSLTPESEGAHSYVDRCVGGSGGDYL